MGDALELPDHDDRGENLNQAVKAEACQSRRASPHRREDH